MKKDRFLTCIEVEEEFMNLVSKMPDTVRLDGNVSAELIGGRLLEAPRADVDIRRATNGSFYLPQ